MQPSNSTFVRNRTSAESCSHGSPEAETEPSATTTTKTTIMSSSPHPGASTMHVPTPGTLIITDTQRQEEEKERGENQTNQSGPYSTSLKPSRPRNRYPFSNSLDEDEDIDEAELDQNLNDTISAIQRLKALSLAISLEVGGKCTLCGGQEGKGKECYGSVGEINIARNTERVSSTFLCFRFAGVIAEAPILFHPRLTSSIKSSRIYAPSCRHMRTIYEFHVLSANH